MSDSFSIDWCFFCESRASEQDKAKRVRIFLELGRSGNQIRYQYADVTVPRCATCSTVHRKRVIRWILRGCAVLGLPIVLGVLFNMRLRQIHSELLIIWHGLGAALGLLIKLRFEKNLQDAGIKSESKGVIKTFPPLKAHLDAGWTLSQPVV
jgi:hypothetical protein